MSHEFTVVCAGRIYGLATPDERTRAALWLQENGEDAARFKEAFPEALTKTNGFLGGTTIPG